MYINKKTYLLERLESIRYDNLLGETVRSIFYKDYQSIQGLMLPMNRSDYEGGRLERYYTFSNYQLDAQIDTSKFILPLNVKKKILPITSKPNRLAFEKVTDKEAALMTREVCRQEGIFVGNSAGAAVAGLLQLKDQLKPEDVVVVIFHDHGSRYMGKMYNEDWLRERGFLKDEKLTARTILAKKETGEIVTIDCEKTVSEAFNTMSTMNISQIPVTQKGMLVGKLEESDILSALLENPSVKSATVETVMGSTFPFVDLNTSIDRLSSLINKDNSAVLVELEDGRFDIITQYDIINAIKG